MLPSALIKNLVSLSFGKMRVWKKSAGVFNIQKKIPKIVEALAKAIKKSTRHIPNHFFSNSSKEAHGKRLNKFWLITILSLMWLNEDIDI